MLSILSSLLLQPNLFFHDLSNIQAKMLYGSNKVLHKRDALTEIPDFGEDIACYSGELVLVSACRSARGRRDRTTLSLVLPQLLHDFCHDH